MFDIDTILFELPGYSMSLLELLAVLTGLAAVWYAARANIITWIFALINASTLLRALLPGESLFGDDPAVLFLLQCYLWLVQLEKAEHQR